MESAARPVHPTLSQRWKAKQPASLAHRTATPAVLQLLASACSAACVAHPAMRAASAEQAPHFWRTGASSAASSVSNAKITDYLQQKHLQRRGMRASCSHQKGLTTALSRNTVRAARCRGARTVACVEYPFSSFFVVALGHVW